MFLCEMIILYTVYAKKSKKNETLFIYTKSDDDEDDDSVALIYT